MILYFGYKELLIYILLVSFPIWESMILCSDLKHFRRAPKNSHDVGTGPGVCDEEHPLRTVDSAHSQLLISRGLYVMLEMGKAASGGVFQGLPQLSPAVSPEPCRLLWPPRSALKPAVALRALGPVPGCWARWSHCSSHAGGLTRSPYIPLKRKASKCEAKK